MTFLKSASFAMAVAGVSTVAPATTSDSTNAIESVRPAIAPVTSRDFYNAGTEKLKEGKLNDAESLLRTALAKQDEKIQPTALYNLGHVRFGQGAEELKKSPSADAVGARAQAVAQKGAQAVSDGEAALEGDDTQRMLAAYMAGRGVRKEAREVAEAFRNAMEVYGKTLLKWQRSLGDFKSTSELNPTDTNAVRNAELVEQAIAKLIDSIRKMQGAMMPMMGRQPKLNDVMEKLRGRIPKEMMPPGSDGDTDDEDFPMDFLRGMKERASNDGEQLGWRLTPDEAADLLRGLRIGDGQHLLMGNGQPGEAADPSRPNW